MYEETDLLSYLSLECRLSTLELIILIVMFINVFHNIETEISLIHKIGIILVIKHEEENTLKSPSMGWPIKL